MTWARLVAVSWLATAALAAAAGAADATEPPVITDPVYTAPVRLVDVGGGRRINLYCRGTGSPAVIFDSGLSDSTIAWARVQPVISETNMTCSYDRAGLGFSDAATRPGTPRNDVDDIHKALRIAGVRPPYVVVGHSSGGRAVRVFADRYRSEVVGMVLVDPSHEDQDRRLQALDKAEGHVRPKPAADEVNCVDAAKSGTIPTDSPAYATCVGEPDARFSEAINAANMRIAATLAYQQAVASEYQTFPREGAEQTRATRRDFGDMPLIVLDAPYTRLKRFTQAQYDARSAMKDQMHRELAAMSSRGSIEYVANTSHLIPFDRPEVVIDAIRRVLAGDN
ncbi:alpha/beta fold hydrolase [Luteibacter aegosomatissinici]|uniref:alpha/beta fold hydrolase n=1 Tax=Luteibacter aegosomatissinici TaxID=2911539 RepID=UPI001FF7728F|nr:alpha/beta hydrolase [Luteibacter aegosomatissinici]UPG96755.1 alpha/beta hydrolase [Luteibacter aegosomatissinici]